MSNTSQKIQNFVKSHGIPDRIYVGFAPDLVVIQGIHELRDIIEPIVNPERYQKGTVYFRYGDKYTEFKDEEETTEPKSKK
jgi:hypothetical protein